MKRACATLSLLVLAGCGATSQDGSGGDAGAGGPECEMVIYPFEPAEPERGDTVVVAGDISSRGASGLFRFAWSATTEGQRVDVERRGDDAIAIRPLRAGIYAVELRGSVGELDCFPATRTLNVRELGAATERYRLRVVPADGGSAAEHEVTIYGGADYDLGALAIDSSASLTGQIVGPGGPISGYVRIRGAGGATVEVFAQEGALQAPKPPGGPPYEVLVMPDDEEVAPALLVGLSEPDLADLRIDAGLEILGELLDADGAGVEGARVSLSVGGVPSTIGETGADGSFSLRARGGEAIVRVRAPAGRGLHDLRAEGVAIDAATELLVRYHPELEPVRVHPQITAADGTTPAPSARVTWIAEPVEVAGEVDDGAGLQLASGSARRAASADHAGGMSELILPLGTYQVVVAPGEGAEPQDAARSVQVDLAEGAPSALALAAPAEIRGVARGAAELAGVRIVASPIQEPTSFPGDAATSGEDGAFALLVSGQIPYEIALSPPPTARLARAWLDVESPLAGAELDLGDVQLPPAIAVYGEIWASGVGALPGAHVSLGCTSCGVARPVAEAVTDATGRFRLLVPDPGSAE
jgi:hypothetical protein